MQKFQLLLGLALIALSIIIFGIMLSGSLNNIAGTLPLLG